MIVTVFRSRLMPDVRDEYVRLVDRMVELASTIPGYISHKGFFAEDGESEEAQRVWRMHPEHRDAQRKGREVYYESHSVQVCQVIRETRFKREAAP
jgi:heme-degrading monooxygenase HmoA